jgi:SAM-dependent methyltransferase
MSIASTAVRRQVADAMNAVCPLCRGALDFGQREIRCKRCAGRFEYRDGFADLVVGGRFDDELGEVQTKYEEQSNDWLSRRYLVPTLRRLLAGVARPRVLSLGCGTGVDIDRLTEHGFDIVGIDNGNRTGAWPRRRHPERLCLANGKHLPFDSGSFDAVYCGCVFPHVGVEGDSNRVRADYQEQRLAMAREMGRVLKTGGQVMVSSPNRWFPIDIFHGRSPDQPYPRLNPPWSPFLLSAGDYRRLFAAAGCTRARLLPVKGYWGFIRQKTRPRGRVLMFPVETVFAAVSTDALRVFRGSPISPWIVVNAEKTDVA